MACFFIKSIESEGAKNKDISSLPMTEVRKLWRIVISLILKKRNEGIKRNLVISLIS